MGRVATSLGGGLRAAWRAGALCEGTVSAVLRHRAGELRHGTAEGRVGRAAEAMHGWAVRVARGHGLAVEVEGAPPAPAAGALVVANHVSYLDVIALAAASPVVFLGMIEIDGWPLLGWAARAAGMVLVDRGSRLSGAAALRRIARLWGDGVNVAAFPEGRTSGGGLVRPFSPALFRLALAHRRPVVPVAVRYDDPAVAWTDGAPFVAHYLQMARRRALQAKLWYGAPLDTPAEGKGVAAGVRLAEAARAAIAARLGARIEEAAA